MKTKPTEKESLPFIKLHEFILMDKNLTPAEKILMSVMFRYDTGKPPKCWQSNATLAKTCGISTRWVRKLIESLMKKNYVWRELATRIIDGKPKTARVVVPLTQGRKRNDRSSPPGTTVPPSPEQPFRNGGTTVPPNKTLIENRIEAGNAASLSLANGFAKPQKKTLTDRNKQRRRIAQQVETFNNTGELTSAKTG